MEQKKQTKNQLAQLKNSYLVAIYKGLANKENISSIHKKLVEETINQKKQGLAISDGMLKQAMKSASSLKKKVKSVTYITGYVETTYGSLVEGATPLELMGIFAFDLLHKNEVEKKLSHQITVQADKIEGDTKIEVIGKNLEHNRSLENPKIFYLASQHKDSATDHRDYQGKMYIDENWRSAIKEEEQIKAIEQYITQNSVKTVQWVTGKPVWFITRPNCRHYFMELGVNEVIKTSRTKLLKQHKMDTAIGDRQYLQTIKHATSREWYDEVRNAQILLEKYKERLKLHQDMYSATPNRIIKNAIAKDKMLIEKWQKYIDSKK